MHNKSLLRSVLLVGLSGSCIGGGELVYSGEVTTPELVVISPGVQVIADSTSPSSTATTTTGGIKVAPGTARRITRVAGSALDAAPVSIRSIERPSAYVHYRAAGMARDRRDYAASKARDRRDRCRLHKLAITARRCRLHKLAITAGPSGPPSRIAEKNRAMCATTTPGRPQGRPPGDRTARTTARTARTTADDRRDHKHDKDDPQ